MYTNVPILTQVDEFPAVSADDIKKAMVELADEPTILMFHAEMEPPVTGTVRGELQKADHEGSLEAYSTFLASRPSTFETCAVEEILSLSHVAPDLALHIVHLSAMEVIPLLRKARAEGVKITAETCFHYLSLAAEEVRDGDTRHKCCPPIRSKLNQDALWAELERYNTDGVIQTVVSDHSPCTPDLKRLPAGIHGHCADDPSEGKGNFFSAWGGVSSVGLGLPIIWTEVSRRKNLTSAPGDSNTTTALQSLVRLCCGNTAAQAGLQGQKGDLAVGYDADICVFDDAAEWVVEPNTMLFRNKCSPYQGKTLRGVVRETWLHGQPIFSKEHGFGTDIPSGKLLLPE